MSTQTELTILPINGKGTVQFTVELYEQLGNVQMKGCTTGPVGDDDQLNLYDGPIDPNDRKRNRVVSKGMRDGDNGCRDIDTGKRWGSGWYVAYWQKDHQTDKYRIVAQAGPTRES